jgi:hypothetical protein
MISNSKKARVPQLQRARKITWNAHAPRNRDARKVMWNARAPAFLIIVILTRKGQRREKVSAHRQSDTPWDNMSDCVLDS